MKHSTGSSCISDTSIIVDQLIDCIADSYRMTEAERAHIHASHTARLIAALPFMAGCKEAQRTALAHLSLYVLAERGAQDIFDHCPADDSDIRARLRLGMQFVGGDTAIINRGMDLLCLQMLCGYERDRNKDRDTGVYNPLNSGAWQYEALTTELVSRIEANPCPRMDTYMSTIGTMGSFWA